VGTVDQVVAAVDVDIFHGIVLRIEGTRRFVAAEQVASVHERGVDLRISAVAIAELPPVAEATPLRRLLACYVAAHLRTATTRWPNTAPRAAIARIVSTYEMTPRQVARSGLPIPMSSGRQTRNVRFRRTKWDLLMAAMPSMKFRVPSIINIVPANMSHP